ncbi:DNA polymerase epsilon subunit C-like isoform X1 [Durio zibethinus]|uniref:DNA polymerase epsilon subunit C-like isoform X1 n=1 Tax=Durio zibethinus TaxID=66656 RepID=A0A6P5ZMZ1_DURZI|nr:DNA polymerase epsilon subunit C-like isoform X1 [Durio zibethinus]
MASSKKPKEEGNNKKKSNSTPAKETKKAIEKPDKKASTQKKPNKSKPKADNNKNKSSNGTLVESEVIADPSSNTESREQENGNKTNKNVKPNKRKRKEKVEENEEEEAKMFTFPMNRIKRIIKSEDSRMAISQDVVFVVNKATEKFLEQFCEDGYKCSVEDRKKSLSYKHLLVLRCSSHICSNGCL